jgi:hypothetical protein
MPSDPHPADPAAALRAMAQSAYPGHVDILATAVLALLDVREAAQAVRADLIDRAKLRDDDAVDCSQSRWQWLNRTLATADTELSRIMEVGNADKR